VSGRREWDSTAICLRYASPLSPIKVFSMAKSIAQINAQIEKLQKQADALKAKEAAGVIARIKVAIEHYGLTAADLGFSERATKTAKPVGTVAVKKTRKNATKKPSGVVRFRDEAGHTWTGNGQRPKWYLAAIEAGKTPESLSV
jgi:DNA-binding protein H-NS